MFILILPIPAAADHHHDADAGADGLLEINLNDHKAALDISRYECENDRSPVTI
mgnify:CR=1 FL=1